MSNEKHTFTSLSLLGKVERAPILCGTTIQTCQGQQRPCGRLPTPKRRSSKSCILGSVSFYLLALFRHHQQRLETLRPQIADLKSRVSQTKSDWNGIRRHIETLEVWLNVCIFPFDLSRVRLLRRKKPTSAAVLVRLEGAKRSSNVSKTMMFRQTLLHFRMLLMCDIIVHLSCSLLTMAFYRMPKSPRSTHCSRVNRY